MASLYTLVCLDSRFERVDNGQVEWFDLDLPEVIELRRKYMGNESGRYHLLACSVFDDAWSPLFIRMGNVQLSKSKFSGKLKWFFLRARQLQSWGRGIKLLEQWGFYDRPEPRMAPDRWAAPLFWLFRPIRILHYRLGINTHK